MHPLASTILIKTAGLYVKADGSGTSIGVVVTPESDRIQFSSKVSHT